MDAIHIFNPECPNKYKSFYLLVISPRTQPWVGDLIWWKPRILTLFSCSPQDYDAFYKDLPDGPAFGADDMEECDRYGHRSVVYKHGTMLLLCQPTAESWLNTRNLGLESWLLWAFWHCHKSATVLSIPQPFQLKKLLRWAPTLTNAYWQIFSSHAILINSQGCHV